MGCETGGVIGGDGARGSSVGGSATRTPLVGFLVVEVAAVPLVLAFARPANPIAAIAEKTAESVKEAATAMRVIRETDRMPFSRA
jgi:hypothetical protein